MASVLDNGQVPAVNAAIGPWVNNNHPLPTGLPADVTAFLQQSNKLPSWADVSQLRRAADFNRRKDTYLFMLYGLGSGIMSTVIPREARSVYWSKGGADMKDRAAKTFTFGYDLSQLNAFESNGKFIVTANKTRMVHAAVRHLLPQLPQWKSGATETIPISNGDILVTFHSLGTFVHSKLKEWKIPMSTADENAFLHSWQVAISLLGVKDEYIPKTWADRTPSRPRCSHRSCCPPPRARRSPRSCSGSSRRSTWASRAASSTSSPATCSATRSPTGSRCHVTWPRPRSSRSAGRRTSCSVRDSSRSCRPTSTSSTSSSERWPWRSSTGAPRPRPLPSRSPTSTVPRPDAVAQRTSDALRRRVRTASDGGRVATCRPARIAGVGTRRVGTRRGASELMGSVGGESPGDGDPNGGTSWPECSLTATDGCAGSLSWIRWPITTRSTGSPRGTSSRGTTAGRSSSPCSGPTASRRSRRCWRRRVSSGSGRRSVTTTPPC
ncbi:hypothetical protein FMEAI12_4500020 [Parafrankia sp. Ea1.12]|nr:hypothetical protein FMEAI12_4500020 [Parafrankia sp. Ea1.12]